MSILPGTLAASRRRAGAAPAVLGYNTKDTSGTSSLTAGRLYVSKFTLASARTMTELHAWMGFGSGGQCRVVIYAADGASGNPGTRLAYTGLKTVASGDVEIFETGFAVALAAADYWLGVSSVVSSTEFYCANSGGTHVGLTSGTPDPPPNPYGSPGTSGTRKHSVWAIVV